MNSGETLSNNEPNSTSTEWDTLSEVKMAEVTPSQTETSTETNESIAETPANDISTSPAEPLPENAVELPESPAAQASNSLAIDTEGNRLKGAAYSVKTLETAVSRWQDRLAQVQSGGFFKRLLNRREINEIKHTIDQRQKELENARKSLASLTAKSEQSQPINQNQAPQTPIESPLEKAA